MVSRRGFLDVAAGIAGAAVLADRAFAGAAPAAGATPPASAGPRELRPLTGGVQPISADERLQRIAKLKTLLAGAKIGALVLESGSTLDYFTGVQWHRSERATAAIIPASGELMLICPAFEEPSVRETLQVEGDVRVWNEHENPFELLAQGLRDRGMRTGVIAVEPTIRFFIVDGIRRASGGYDIVSGDPLVRACRFVKSPHELALMQVANDITLAALRHAHEHVVAGMSGSELASLVDTATVALGGSPEFALALLNEASAYPHGSRQLQVVREGSVILMDCGCTVHGYQSDISRTWVYGAATARQRRVWDTVKRGQEIALGAARPGAPVGRIDDAVRAYYEGEGWGPGYKLPGLSHRTGHGIGLDGHESPYLVHGDPTPLQTGMCFSDEPGIYLPGEFGIRLEDCWHMMPAGPQTFTPLAKSLDDPI